MFHLRDVLDGFMTREQARTDYDVVIRDNLTLDHEARRRCGVDLSIWVSRKLGERRRRSERWRCHCLGE